MLQLKIKVNRLNNSQLRLIVSFSNFELLLLEPSIILATVSNFIIWNLLPYCDSDNRYIQFWLQEELLRFAKIYMLVELTHI